MTTVARPRLPGPLPVRRELGPPFALSLLAAVIMALVAAGGVLFPAVFYPTDELLQAYLATDAVNLVVGLPFLLGALWLARRGRLIGLLAWPGALLCVLYNEIAYLFGLPLGALTFAHLALALISVYVILDLLRRIDGPSVQARLAGAVFEGVAGWVAVGFGTLFGLMAIGGLVQGFTDPGAASAPAAGVQVADLVVSTAWTAGGVLLLRRRPLGYVGGLGLLSAASALFVGVILVVILQPQLTGTPFDLAGLIILVVMGLVCFVPFALFVRGVLAEEKQASG